jgi:hypothetical protein
MILLGIIRTVHPTTVLNFTANSFVPLANSGTTKGVLLVNASVRAKKEKFKFIID